MKNVQKFCWAAFFTASACTAFGAAPAGSQPAAPTQPSPIVVGAPRTNILVFEGRDPDKIADNDTIITQIIPLQYLSGYDMLNTLSAVIKSDTTIAATPNAIVVTDASSVVKRIVQIICYLDFRPGGENVIAIIPLGSGNATEAAREINAVFSSQR